MTTFKLKQALLSIILVGALLLSGCELIPEFLGTPTPTPTLSPAPPTVPTPTPINPTYTPPVSISSPTPLMSIADVVAKVRPSVVAINTEVVAYDIFNRPSTQKGAGSGWIIDSNGLIVTNNHVVEGAKTITATLEGGQSFTAKTVRTDPINDLAVIDVGVGNLPAASIGDSSRMRVGDWVIAIGNALGQGIRATEGIISAVGVNVTVDSGDTLYNLLETTAAINPGNSGGPLVNMAGEVIGIASAKLAAIGVEGMGYAISSAVARPIIQELIQRGYVIHPYLGVSVSSVTQFLVTRYNLAVDKGAFVTEITLGGPAGSAGIRAGDVIVKFGSKDVTSADELVQAIRSGKVGDAIEIVYWRGSEKLTVSATLVEAPPPQR